MLLGVSAAYLGPLYGLATSVLWTLTGVCFTAAGRRIGPAAVNSVRILLACVWLALTHRVLSGTWVPDLAARQAWLLAASGWIGLTLGDLALFTAYVRIGPRLAMLLMTTAPLLVALLGRGFLGERLGKWGWCGMALTLGGVAWVVLERPAQAQDAHHRAHRLSGIVLGLVAAACQAVGSLLSKAGIGHGWLPPEAQLAPQTAALVRMFFAAVGVLPLVAWLVLRARRTPLPAARTGGTRRWGYFFTLCGSLVGPYLGVWASLEAFHRTSLGVAQTLCSLPPVLFLPLAVWVYGERVTRRAVCGAVAAVAGTALLFVQAG